MDEDKALIAMVLDRSSSMESLTKETIAGVNKFIAEQQAVPGKCDFTLVQFSTDYTFTYNHVPLKDVKPLTEDTYRPHGWTALLDAMGRCIDETGNHLHAMPEAERPGKVIFVVITDGEENRSKEYTRAVVAEKVKRQTDVYKWQFVFLGANMDAIAAAGDIGIAPAAAAAFVATPKGLNHLYSNVSTNARSYRSGGAVGMSWSTEQRNQMDPDKK